MSCLFESLSNLSDLLDAHITRKIIHRELKRTKKIDGLSIKNIVDEDYIDNLEKTDFWGSALEIRIFCDIFNISVWVYIIETKKWIKFCEQNKKYIRISWSGCHYEYLDKNI